MEAKQRETKMVFGDLKVVMENGNMMLGSGTL